MAFIVSVLLLRSIRLQVLNDLSAATKAHNKQYWYVTKLPPNLTFPISHSVCNAFKYKKLFVQCPFDPCRSKYLMKYLWMKGYYVWNLLPDNPVWDWGKAVRGRVEIKQASSGVSIRCLVLVIREIILFSLLFIVLIFVFENFQNTKLRINFIWCIVKI